MQMVLIMLMLISVQHLKGEWVIDVVTSGVEVRVSYDSVKGKLYTDWS